MTAQQSKPSPFLFANTWSRIFHSWICQLLDTSHRQKTLHLIDLYDLLPEYESIKLTGKLENNWFDEIKRHPDKPNLFHATIRAMKWKPLLLGYFDKVRQQYQSKPQLQGKDLSLIQIYECDTVSICFIDEHKIMKYDDIENIIQSVRKNIFTFQLVNEYCAEVEFINANAFKEWMSIVEKVKTKFHITVTPIINEIDDENAEQSIPNSTENIPFTVNKPNPVTITLRREWSMVVAHPIFKVEYKDYIRNELGGEIEINGNDVTYAGNFPCLPRCPSNQAILANKTNNYMQKLKYQTLHDLKQYHVNILRANSTTVAFNRIQRNDYMIAGKPNDIFELRNKLFQKTHQTERTYSARNSQFNDR
ncbi:unnamed protein product [Rotaria sp. Silwood2]|nr:unnamed protein product [Rotaria sp. Silwood2]